jgi:hypothetical protein
MREETTMRATAPTKNLHPTPKPYIPTPPPRVSLVPKDETKEAKFIRLANTRVKKAITAIRSIGRMGTSAYNRDSDQIAKLETTLLSEVKDMAAKLRSGHEDKVGDIL